MMKIIIISATIPFIMYTFKFGIKNSFYLLPLWAVSIIWFLWAYYVIKQTYE